MDTKNILCHHNIYDISIKGNWSLCIKEIFSMVLYYILFVFLNVVKICVALLLAHRASWQCLLRHNTRFIFVTEHFLHLAKQKLNKFLRLIHLENNLILSHLPVTYMSQEW